MKTIFLFFVMQLVMPLALAHSQQSQPASPSQQPKTLVQSFYQQVLARHPIGIPTGGDMKALTPFLSDALLNRINLAAACGADWYRQNPNSHLKPEFDWLELGLFSGSDEQATPSSFVVTGTQSQKNGSIRVCVTLTYKEPQERPWIWHVAAIVVLENGHYVVDDVVYLKEPGESAESRLSAALSDGCEGRHWVGYGKRRKDRKQRR